MEQTLSAQERPALDEATFQQLLEAAYVLQEHPELRANPDKPDPVEALSEIVETQELLRSQPYDLPAAANLIAQRLANITHASGVAIAVVREDHLEYCASIGSRADLAGTHLPWDSNLSAGPGQPETTDKHGTPPISIANSLPSTQVCEANSVKSPFLIPIHHDGKVAGLLELRFADPDAIEETDVQSCRLMAGLMSEAITREAELQWKQALAAERATMLGALERIKPQLERLALEPAIESAKVTKSATPVPGEAAAPLPTVDVYPSGADVLCPHCGFQFLGEKDLFCGRCGAPRIVPVWPVDDLQRQLDSLGDSAPGVEEKQEATPAPPIAEVQNPVEETEAGVLSEPALPTGIEEFSAEAEPASENDSLLVVSPNAVDETISAPAVGNGQVSHSPFASATKAHKWLQTLEAEAPGTVWFTKHRANIYVGAAVILLLVVLSGWGTPPRYHNGKNPLSLGDRLLISLGLAEAPSAPAYTGNPNAQVWVDLHTALYYCPGSDLYGKTPGGKFTTQRDAQLDQFEPAARRSCD